MSGSYKFPQFHLYTISLSMKGVAGRTKRLVPLIIATTNKIIVFAIMMYHITATADYFKVTPFSWSAGEENLVDSI